MRVGGSCWSDKGERGALTYADDIHEAVHAVADLKEKILPLPLGRRAEWGPDEPGDASDEEERAQNYGRNLDLLNDRQGDGLPLCERKDSKKSQKKMEGQAMGGSEEEDVLGAFGQD